MELEERKIYYFIKYEERQNTYILLFCLTFSKNLFLASSANILCFTINVFFYNLYKVLRSRLY